MSARQGFAGVLGVVVLFAVGLLLSPAAGQKKAPAHSKEVVAAAPAAAVVAGQTNTLLADGRWLIAAGVGPSGALKRAALRNPDSDTAVPLPSDLQFARAWHTATVLPDGTVLLLGGLDAKGLVATAELFDPAKQTFQTIATDLAPRAYHTATLLTDGRVLVAGGVSADGRLLSELELWDFRKRVVQKLDARLDAGRRNHSASLLPDGRVLLAGGLGQDGQELPNAEIYDPAFQNLITVEGARRPESRDTLTLEASIPADGSTGVALDAWIGLRFSKPLQVSTVNQTTVTLWEGDRAVVAKVVAAEAGRLAFVAPELPLVSGASYRLVLKGLADAGAELPAIEVRFTTADDGLSQQPNQATGRARGKDDPDDLPPLQAAPGVTALSGRVLTLNGKGLAGVTLETICGDNEQEAISDSTGRFLIARIPSGHCKLEIDGASANGQGKRYGLYFAGVDIIQGQTNVLPYMIWMTEIDWPHTVRIPSSLQSEFVVISPLLQGLELRLAPGTVIRDYDHNVVNEISITPIPTGRPPFPLPAGVSVPFYFTIQPGGAYLNVGARLIYPNVNRAPAGAKFNFWNYDPAGRGWYVYGTGTVTPDRRRIEPDPGVTLYGFTGAMVASPGFAPPFGPAPDCGPSCRDGDPVDLGTGLFTRQETDLFLPDVIPIQLTRTYRQADSVSRAFGIGTTHPWEMFLIGDNVTYQYADLILPDGGRIHYTRTSPGNGFSNAVYEHTTTPGRFYKSKLQWVQPGLNIPYGFHLTLKDGTLYSFLPADGISFVAQGAVRGIKDRYGNELRLTRASNGNLIRITSQNGRWIDFTYDSANRITQARDNIGRAVSYAYDFGGRLVTVTNPLGGVSQYTYDANNQMLTLQNPRQIVFLTNEYDASGRVSRQTRANGTFYQFAYTLDVTGNVSQVDVTDPRGILRRVTFGGNGYFSGGYSTGVTRTVGMPEQHATAYQRQAGSNLVLGVTDPLGRSTTYTYDACGNQASVTRAAGTPQAATWSFTYQTANPCVSTFSQMTSVTDPLGHVTSFEYDSNGNLTKVTNPLGNSTTYTYNAAGQQTSLTDAAGTTQFGYTSGEPTTMTDPLGRTVTNSYDAVGRLVAQTNPLGYTTRWQYDARNRVTSSTDPLSSVVTLAYDATGNLLSITDPRGGATNHSYNNMNRLAGRTDALQRAETFQYNALGNLALFTDRKSQVGQQVFDNLNRTMQLTYADNSTTSFAYDAGGRLTQVVDSISGTITRTYDVFDRVTQETTPQGTISYTYDAAGRRISMSVAGQLAVSYTYDNANRLTAITQGTSTVSLAYDAANRRTSVTLPNGVTVIYGYDAASQLTSLTYQLGGSTIGNLTGSTIGNLTYTYDAGGNRIQVGGSLAATGLPQALTSATYDAANQATQFGATTRTYDATGNLISDGTNTYTWDARNQLVAISGGVTASFQYDAFGRRISKTVNGTATQFLYDGESIVQELSAGLVPTANLLNGPAIDEIFQRTDSAGARIPLADAVGSTIALLDSAGAIQTRYTYEPFGRVTVSGAASTNPFQYTGRENDGTGLYYYRARYYDPVVGRFISEDPIGHRGGMNLYRYVNNSPVNSSDPFGLFAIRDEIKKDYLRTVAGLDEACADRTGGACTNVGAGVECYCECLENGVVMARADLVYSGRMSIFDGNWADFLRQRRPRDPSVRDRESAEAHEYREHIDIARREVAPLINELEGRVFSSEDECQAECKKTSGEVNLKFAEALRKTKGY